MLVGADGEVKNSDDYIKIQGLVGKYNVLVRIGTWAGINVTEIWVSGDRVSVANDINCMANEEENNYLLGVGGKNVELNESQDIIVCGAPLVPEGCVLTEENSIIIFIYFFLRYSY